MLLKRGKILKEVKEGCKKLFVEFFSILSYHEV